MIGSCLDYRIEAERQPVWKRQDIEMIDHGTEKMTEPNETVPPVLNGKRVMWRIAPILALVALVVAFFALGLDQYVNLQTVADHQGALKAFVEENFVTAIIAYLLFYMVFVAVSVPGAAVLTVTGGFLFGTLLGGTLTVFGATAGATGIFLLARTTIGDILRKHAKGAISRMSEGFRKDGFNYLLVLRLVPVFPFFVVNVAPAFLGMKLSSFVAATFLGIVPGTFVFASVGAGLGSVFARGDEITLGGVMTPQIITALVGLAVLALIPVGIRHWRGRRL